jgi:putative oxidoreductase
MAAEAETAIPDDSRRMPAPAAMAVARVAAGLVFLGFGVAKFVNHATELRSFREYGLPLPEAFVYAVGVVEIVGGLLLVLGVATRLSALVLATDMVGAIVVSGIKEGEPISLTLAPALLVVMLLLLWSSRDIRSGPAGADTPGAYAANDPPGHGTPE